MGRSRSRFIPTPVGNTGFGMAQPGAEAVHPHARGEHLWNLMTLGVGGGSSPRPWGTPRENTPYIPQPRFIPTPVGNTHHPEVLRRHRPVHPHARGEHQSAWMKSSSLFGSSPRPWGTRRVLQEANFDRRFIPTPVGNTSLAGSICHSHAVHPHARGEHIDVDVLLSRCDGSSPRPWGTRTPGRRPGDRDRFIPTPVGNTTRRRHCRSICPVHPHARGEHAHVPAPWAK